MDSGFDAIASPRNDDGYVGLFGTTVKSVCAIASTAMHIIVMAGLVPAIHVSASI
jgi:hypothetical protein